MAIGWKTRVGLVLSAIWLFLVFLLSSEDHRIGATLGVGVLPLVVVWGIGWAIAGWRAQRQPNDSRAEELTADRRRKWRSVLKTSFAVIAVLAVGVFAANWQFQHSGNEAGSSAIAGWFGEWLVYGFIAYVLLRAVQPRLPIKLPAVIAALIAVGGVNWKAYDGIAEERQARDSLALAAPFLSRILSGSIVSDNEIVGARIGTLEPLLLAQAAHSREVKAIADSYEAAFKGLQLEQALAATSAGTSAGRLDTRSKLKLWALAVTEYKSQMAGATARGKLGVGAAVAKMPHSYGTARAGFDEATAQLTAFVESQSALELEASEAVSAILDVLDASPGAYFISKDPTPNLLFRDEATLMNYQRRNAALMDVIERQQQERDRYLALQTSRTERITDLLKQ